MSVVALFILLNVAVFLGAFVSGVAGFAFSAVAGAILLHRLTPVEAVPLMMACSVAVQASNLWALRRDIQWRQSLVLVLGGLLGVPIAVALLQVADTRTFRELFGLAVAFYAGYMLFRPAFAYTQQMNSGRNALVGFGGGLIGGLTAMPGALPTIWCDIHGVPKTKQRGMVQPFIATMQIFGLVLMLARHELSSKIAVDFALCIPALVTGSAFGLLAFRNVSEQNFRRIILVVLLVSGLFLAV